MADDIPYSTQAPGRCRRAAGGCDARCFQRPVPIRSCFPDDLPITAEEIHKVLAALGPDLAALFEEDG
jgi:hypothetical protein